MRVFLASSYHSGSHRSWADGYAAASGHDVHLITMPGSFWQWRLTGGYVTLAEGVEEAVRHQGEPDVVLATSMVDVAGLRGLLAPRLGPIPTALYMHENQITYPAISRSRTERTYELVNWTSLLAADAVAFNSRFHHDALLDALPRFLNEFPDERQRHLVETVEEKSVVLSVGCDVDSIPTGPKDHPPLVLWNHRWDPDKDPASFIRIVRRTAEEGSDFRVALTGERFVNQRPEYDEDVAALDDLVIVDDHLDRDRYLEVLGRSTIVISTALQEFFGVSVVEAIAAGAFPILPDRLVYRERVPVEFADRMLYRSEAEAVALLKAALGSLSKTRQSGAALRGTVAQFDWAGMAPRYDDWLESIGPS